MTKLSEVLNFTRSNAEPIMLNLNTLNMPQAGLMQKVGKMNTQYTKSEPEPMNTTRLQQGGKQEQKVPISDSLDDKRKLTALIKSCYESLNTYGKSTEALEAIIMLMQMTLARFNYDAVRAAFGVYLQSSSEMPKPADIIKILEPKPEPRKWCATIFIDIKRRSRENQFITNAEKAYCEDFIASRINNPDSEVDAAIKQVEQQNKQYWLE